MPEVKKGFKKKWIIISIVFVILIGMVILLYVFPSPIENLAHSENNSKICGIILNQGDKDWCYLGFIMVEKDSSLCDKMIAVDTKYFCYNTVAIENLNSSICDKIDENNSDSSIALLKNLWVDRKNSCYAITKGNVSMCKDIGTDIIQADCYTKLAAIKKDQTICENINDTDDKQFCYWRS